MKTNMMRKIGLFLILLCKDAIEPLKKGIILFSMLGVIVIFNYLLQLLFALVFPVNGVEIFLWMGIVFFIVIALTFIGLIIFSSYRYFMGVWSNAKKIMEVEELNKSEKG